MTDSAGGVVGRVMARWNAYPEYKDSRIEWLGNIPAHWQLGPLKRGFDVQLGKMLQPAPVTSQDTSEPYLRAANVRWDRVDVSDVREMWFAPYEKEQYSLRPGDLLVSEGGDVGRSALWKGELQNCYIQNAINRVRSKGPQSTRYLFYWMYALKHNGFIDVFCNRATIAHFTAEKVERLPVPFLPLDEERQIVQFLDRETEKIDALIAKKERLIDLLREKRTALISQAVTKGLDPNAPAKDSGIEWLGEIPVHWSVKRVKFLAWFNYGDSLAADAREDGAVPVYGSNGPVGTHSRSNAVGPCVIIGRKGSFGKVSWCEVPCFAIDTTFYIDQSTATANMRWLYYALPLLGLDALSQDAAVPGLSREHAHDQWLPNAPSDEQRAIADFVDRETAKIDALVAKLHEAIDRLREYRTALISAAVTGKIDVREAAS